MLSLTYYVTFHLFYIRILSPGFPLFNKLYILLYVLFTDSICVKYSMDESI